MQVILLKDVEQIGLRGEVVDVARGYARNYLLPRQLAEAATPGALEDLRRRDEVRARQEARTHEEARDIAARLEQTVLRFDVKAGPTGSLFGSVTATDICRGDSTSWRVPRFLLGEFLIHPFVVIVARFKGRPAAHLVMSPAA